MWADKPTAPEPPQDQLHRVHCAGLGLLSSEKRSVSQRRALAAHEEFTLDHRLPWSHSSSRSCLHLLLRLHPVWGSGGLVPVLGLPLAVCGVLSRSGPRSGPQSPIFPGSGTTLKGTVPTKGLVLPSQQLGGVSVSILQMRRATERVRATHPSPREPVAPGHILGIP